MGANRGTIMATENKVKRVQRAPLAAHPAFRLIVAAWLAALLGLAVLVLAGKPVAAGGAAAFGGGLGWLVARLAAKRSGKTTALAETEEVPGVPERLLKIESDRPAILDVTELGFASLDAEFSEPEDTAIGDPVEMEVEIEVEESEDGGLVEIEEPALSEAGTRAATALKRQPVGQMSLVQMIERFAHALDEHREAAAHNDDNGSTVTRLPSPALIEALRTLPVVNPAPLRHYAGDGNAALAIATSEQAEETERALRRALEKLQRMSGGN